MVQEGAGGAGDIAVYHLLRGEEGLDGAEGMTVVVGVGEEWAVGGGDFQSSTPIKMTISSKVATILISHLQAIFLTMIATWELEEATERFCQEILTTGVMMLDFDLRAMMIQEVASWVEKAMAEIAIVTLIEVPSTVTKTSIIVAVVGAQEEGMVGNKKVAVQEVVVGVDTWIEIALQEEDQTIPTTGLIPIMIQIETVIVPLPQESGRIELGAQEIVLQTEHETGNGEME